MSNVKILLRQVGSRNTTGSQNTTEICTLQRLYSATRLIPHRGSQNTTKQAY